MIGITLYREWLRRTDILAILNLHTYEQRISPIYMVLLWFSLPEGFSFLHIYLTHILLALYLSISFWGGANINGIVFLISNSIYSLLAYRKAIDFLYSSVPETLLSLFISLNFFIQFLQIFYIDSHVICKQRQLSFSF